MYDIAQWALNRDGDAPVQVIPAVPNDPDRKSLTYVYDDGVKLCARAQTEFSGKGADNSSDYTAQNRLSPIIQYGSS